MKKQQKKHLRKRYFVDPDVQNGLLKRILIYYAASLVFITLPLAFINFIIDPSQMFVAHVGNVYASYWPLLLMMFLILPIALNDAVKFSNRFVGPIYRMRRELKRFEDGQPLRPFAFRKGDFWPDLADSFNHVTERMNQLEEQVSEIREPEPV